MFSLPAETPQETRARKKQKKAALEAEALALALAEAKTELPWKILRLISKACAVGAAFSLKTPCRESNWKLSFEDNILIEFSSEVLASRAELNNLEWHLDRARVTLNQMLEDQNAAKVRQARKAQLLDSLSTEDQEILGLTKPKNPRWP
jgi:hypothetical protein